MTNTIKALSRLCILLSAGLISSAAIAVSENTPTDLLSTLPTYSKVYDPQRDAFKDGAAAIQLASNTNRRILIELGGDWCKWCHVLDAFLDNNPDIKQQLHQTFVMLKVNVSDANNNADFLKAFPRPLGYPHMYVSEYDGSVLWSKDTAELLKDGEYSRELFIAFFNRWKIDNTRKTTTELSSK